MKPSPGGDHAAAAHLTCDRVGFVGTGVMGSAMAGRLLAAGQDVVVHNRTRARATDLEAAGAEWADRPADVTTASRVVLSCLRDTTAVEDVYLGAHGLLSAAGPGQVFVEHGTFAPDLARHLASSARARGAAFVDMPVTGGPDGARQGTLTAMAGGDLVVIDRVIRVVDAYCAEVTRMGGHGAGLELKLVNQLLVSVHMAVAGEAIEMLVRLGLDLGRARRVLTASWAHSTMFERTLTNVIAGRYAATGVIIDAMVEVQDLVAKLAEDIVTGAPVFATSRETFEDAVYAGAGGRDPAMLARLHLDADFGLEHHPPRHLSAGTADREEELP